MLFRSTSKKGNAITVEVSYTFVTPLATQTVTESHEYVVYTKVELRKPDRRVIIRNGERIENDSGQRFKRI